MTAAVALQVYRDSVAFGIGLAGFEGWVMPRHGTSVQLGRESVAGWFRRIQFSEVEQPVIFVQAALMAAGVNRRAGQLADLNPASQVGAIIAQIANVLREALQSPSKP